MSTSRNALHSQKALRPISVSPAGRRTSRRFSQPWKVHLPIRGTPSGMAIVSNALHSTNAHAPNARKVVGNVHTRNVLHHQNASSPMATTPSGMSKASSASIRLA